MYCDMDQWLDIRRKVLVEGVSKRQVLRETGMHWTTLEKMLSHGKPPGYRAKAPRPKPKVGPYLERIAQILASDKELPKKQRHTAQRIFVRLSEEEGYSGEESYPVFDRVRLGILQHRVKTLFDTNPRGSHFGKDRYLDLE